MHRILTKWLDRAALRSAERSVKPVPGAVERATCIRESLMQSDFLSETVARPPEVIFTDRDFHFASYRTSGYSENDVVHGRFFRCHEWRKHPTTILIHGWNAELGYRFQFPWLAWRLNRRALNAVTIELPFHAQRKPSSSRLNFLSGDLVRMMEATRQAVADIRSLVSWLLAQDNPSVGVWGFSLGAWLAGLIACHDPRLQFAVLVTPVAKMERAIAELPFCRPIRHTCEGAGIHPDHLNLVRYEPRIPRDRILLVEATHDLFAPAETIEEIWQHWQHPPIWRVPHGHISILLSAPLMERIVQWIARPQCSVISAP